MTLSHAPFMAYVALRVTDFTKDLVSEDFGRHNLVYRLNIDLLMWDEL